MLCTLHRVQGHLGQTGALHHLLEPMIIDQARLSYEAYLQRVPALVRLSNDVYLKFSVIGWFD